MNIAIVSNAPTVIEVLQRTIVHSQAHHLHWVALSVADATRQAAAAAPELLLLDVRLSSDGADVTRRIMAACDCPVLLVTTGAAGESARIFEALGAGALDVAALPTLGPDGSVADTDALLTRLAMVQRTVQQVRPLAPASPPRPSQPLPDMVAPLVVIGASAGGPAALATILQHLPPSFPGAIVIVQHIDVRFAEGLAQWLGEQSAVPVRVARDGDCPVRGTALVACSLDHLVLGERATLRYVATPTSTDHRPSIDVFFQSVAARWRGAAVGVLLTGMGRDGARGLRTLRDRGAITLAQDRHDCVVYGMPKAAKDLDAVDEVVPLADMASRLTELCRELSSTAAESPHA